MQEFIIDLMDQAGYLGICFLIIAENIFPPIPSEAILFFGGFMTIHTNMTIPGVIFFSTLGSLTGAIILYEIGSLLTIQRLEWMVSKRAFRWLGFEKKDIMKTIDWFKKHGPRAVLFGRCIPVIRSLISIPAGMAGISLPVFLSYTLFGSAVWNTLLISLGAFLGVSWDNIAYYFNTYSSIVILVLILGLLIMFLRRLKKKKII